MKHPIIPLNCHLDIRTPEFFIGAQGRVAAGRKVCQPHQTLSGGLEVFSRDEVLKTHIAAHTHTHTIYMYNTYTSRRGDNRASSCSSFGIKCAWRHSAVIISCYNCTLKIPGILKTHFNILLFLTGHSFFKARRRFPPHFCNRLCNVASD